MLAGPQKWGRVSPARNKAELHGFLLAGHSSWVPYENYTQRITPLRLTSEPLGPTYAQCQVGKTSVTESPPVPRGRETYVLFLKNSFTEV